MIIRALETLKKLSKKFDISFSKCIIIVFLTKVPSARIMMEVSNGRMIRWHKDQFTILEKKLKIR